MTAGGALPVTVVKFGGAAVAGGPGALARFARGCAELRQQARVVVVHGGGPQITALLGRLGLDSQFRAGLRVSTPEVVSAARAALLGEVAPDIVMALQRLGVTALGMSGADAGVLTARPAQVALNGESVDLGWVGELAEINVEVLRRVIELGWVPVLASVAPGADGHWFNINADSAAGVIAGALNATRLVILTDVPGIYERWPAAESLLAEADAETLRGLLPGAERGIRPKILAVLDALDAGVAEVIVTDALGAAGTVCRGSAGTARD